ncbi:hypothetical protein [Flaviflexus massiliensis]|uniref:hypothetical protein n=1 Tax=Flaviflexus massiliensis TaxID=1522309 RepID=UPI0006D55280|nr:hypothetical protein [Flaviflexus massiliensis]
MDGIHAGEFDGDGKDSFAARRGSAFLISNVLEGGPAETTLRCGKAADDILVGDWDGNGTDTPGVNRIR